MPKSLEIVFGPVEEFIPRMRQKYVDVHGTLDMCVKLCAPQSWLDGEEDAEESSNLLVSGPHGLGKSLMLAALAVRIGEALGKDVPMVVFDCHQDVREYHLRGGERVNSDGSTYFMAGPLPTAIHLANQVGCCVLCLEEISALQPGAQKQINPLTDWRRAIYVPQVGKTFRLHDTRCKKCGTSWSHWNQEACPSCGAREAHFEKYDPRVIVVGSMNPSDAYSGVYALNDDLRSRFDELVLGYPTPEAEKKILRSESPRADMGLIERAVQFSGDTRTDATDYKLSTRDLKRFLSVHSKLGGDDEAALRFVLNKFRGSDKKTVRDRIKGAFSVNLKD